METQVKKSGKVRKVKSYRTGNQKLALRIVSALRDASIVVRQHVIAGFDIPADCRTNLASANAAIMAAIGTLGQSKVVPPNGEVK